MNLSDNRLAPYPPIHSSTNELLQQMGEVKLSCRLIPVRDGKANKYFMYHAHLTTHGIILESKADKEGYEIDKGIRKVAGLGFGLAGMSSPGSKRVFEKSGRA